MALARLTPEPDLCVLQLRAAAHRRRRVVGLLALGALLSVAAVAGAQTLLAPRALLPDESQVVFVVAPRSLIFNWKNEEMRDFVVGPRMYWDRNSPKTRIGY